MPATRQSRPKRPVRKRKGRENSKEVLIFAISLFAIFLLIAVNQFSNPQVSPIPANSPQAYFENNAPYAQKVGHSYSLYPSVMLAQSALESDFGRSTLSKDYNNFFGIKGKGSAGSASLTTKEFTDQGWVEITDSFRAYRTPLHSFQDYAKLITSYERYAPVVNAKSPQEACYALGQSGYATDPNYGQKLTTMIDEYHLEQYDQIPS